MTLPSSGPISMYQICDEFKVPRSTPLLSLYRGGGIVPNTIANTNIPTSGPISFTDFYGASSSTNPVAFVGSNVFTTPTISSIVGLGVRVKSNGAMAAIYLVSSGGAEPVTNEVVLGAWASQPVLGAYQVRFIVQGIAGQWQTISTDRQYTTVVAPGNSIAVTVHIREISDNSNQAQRVYTITRG